MKDWNLGSNTGSYQFEGSETFRFTPILHVTNYKHEILDKELCVEKIEGEKNERQIANIPNLQTLAPNDNKSYEIFDSQVLAATSSEEAIAYTNQYHCASTPVLDPRVAFTITDILKDNQARTPAFGSNSLLVIPKHPEVAVKTGTSNDLRDNLAIGYTKDYVVAVWVGNNDNSQMNRIASGVTGATPIWHTVMSGLLSPIDSYEWTVPPRMTKTSVCPYTGTLACQGCPNKEEWFLEENSPTLSCRSFVKLEEKKENGTQAEKPKPRREIIDLREIKERIKKQGQRFSQ
jgi:membrane carboxypeptidase/penicillin-binding protein PbpC